MFEKWKSQFASAARMRELELQLNAQQAITGAILQKLKVTAEMQLSQDGYPTRLVLKKATRKYSKKKTSTKKVSAAVSVLDTEVAPKVHKPRTRKAPTADVRIPPTPTTNVNEDYLS